MRVDWRGTVPIWQKKIELVGNKLATFPFDVVRTDGLTGVCSDVVVERNGRATVEIVTSHGDIVRGTIGALAMIGWQPDDPPKVTP